MPDLPSSEPIPLNKVEIDGRRISRATVQRWISRGLITNGSRVILATRLIGGRRFTDPASIRTFLARLNGIDQAATPEDLRRAHAAAEQELSAIGA